MNYLNVASASNLPPKIPSRTLAALETHLDSQRISPFGGRRTRGYVRRNSIESPLLTVVTAVFNSAETIERTINSVLCQTYENIEYIVIDGGSTDGTLDVIRKYEHSLDYWLSEADRGVYDAMNKGINASNGIWLSFLNANDIYCETSTIASLFGRHSTGKARFVYSDVLLTNGDSPFRHHLCDHEKLIVNHQASIYRKALHSEHGLYLVAPGVTISDYLFFSLIDRSEYVKEDTPIAIYDTTGMSQSHAASRQKFVVDYLINKMPWHKFLLYFSFYFYYRRVKSALTGLFVG